MKIILLMMCIFLCSCNTTHEQKKTSFYVNDHPYFYVGTTAVHDPDCPKCKAALQVK